jgi:biotin carboxyl carrier protein
MESAMRRVTLVSDGRTFPLEVAEDSGKLRVTLSGEPIEIEVGDQTSGGMSLLVGDRSYEAQVDIQDRQIAVELEGERFLFELEEVLLGGRGSRRDGHGGVVEVKAPMPGKVVKLLVSVGEAVESGQGILLFEAMKMQNEIRSPMAGAVVDLVVQEGQAVESRETLFSVKSGPE